LSRGEPTTGTSAEPTTETMGDTEPGGVPTSASGPDVATTSGAGGTANSGVTTEATADCATDCTTGCATDCASECAAGCCEPSVCGDGVVTCEEECDAADPKLCNDDCTRPCGDGDVDPGEQCDTEDPLTKSACELGCVFRGRRVFVTSMLFVGAFDLWDGPPGNALEQADGWCHEMAVMAGLPHVDDAKVKFRAWLSAGGQSPATRFRAKLEEKIPYILVDGQHIAESLEDVLDGTLAAPIRLDEKGVASALTSVFTGTKADGEALDPDGMNATTSTCDDWTVNKLDGKDILAGYGLTNESDGRWTANGYVECKKSLPIYCFEDVSDP
jgi:hypothetical protein